MRTRREREHGFGLTTAEMAMLVIGRDRLLELFTRQLCVDQKMVMAGIGRLHPGGSDAHAGKPKLHLERAGYGVTVLQIDEIDHGGQEAMSFLRRLRAWRPWR